MITATYHNMLNFVNKLFGGLGSNNIKKYEKLVSKINQFETTFSKLTDDELKIRPNILKIKLKLKI